MYLSMAAYAGLRVVVGACLMYLGYRHVGPDRAKLREALAPRFPRMGTFIAGYLAAWELVLGFLFIAGFMTQIVAAITVLYALKVLFLYRRTLAHPVMPSPMFFILLAAIAASLFITGAGILAFDIPV